MSRKRWVQPLHPVEISACLGQADALQYIKKEVVGLASKGVVGAVPLSEKPPKFKPFILSLRSWRGCGACGAGGRAPNEFEPLRF
jgi:hypothetical protein